MSRSVPDRALTLAAELRLRFAQDTQLATRLNDAHQRLQRANQRLWWGVHPDGMAAVYGEHPAAVEAGVRENQSQALGARDPLQAPDPVLRPGFRAVAGRAAAGLAQALSGRPRGATTSPGTTAPSGGAARPGDAS